MHTLLHIALLACSILSIIIASLFLLAVAIVATLVYGAGKLYKAQGTDYDERTLK